nr:hypothetical protein [Bdellovibrio sp. ZAP7]
MEYYDKSIALPSQQIEDRFDAIVLGGVTAYILAPPDIAKVHKDMPLP